MVEFGCEWGRTTGRMRGELVKFGCNSGCIAGNMDGVGWLNLAEPFRQRPGTKRGKVPTFGGHMHGR